MGALRSIGPALGSIVRNPVLLVATGLYVLILLPQLALQSQPSLTFVAASMLLSLLMLVLTPFYQGGLLGMAGEAVAGKTSLGTFVAEGKSNYLQLLLASLILFAINFAFGIFGFLGILFGSVGIVAGGTDPSTAAIAIFVVVAGLVVLAYLVVNLFLQFHPHAIVLSDRDVVEAFTRSAGLVRRNFLSTLGYTIMVTIGGGLFGLLVGGASVFAAGEEISGLALPEPTVPLLVGLAVGFSLLTAVVSAFYATYSVSFYRDLEAAADTA
jgi:hypothetical protein